MRWRPRFISIPAAAGAWLLVLSLAVVACSTTPPAHLLQGAGDVPLHALADFPIGVAVPIDPRPNSLLRSAERQALVNRHFDSLTAENGMKIRNLQPERGCFTFTHADALTKYAKQHGMLVHGHTLVWHRSLPDWMNELQGAREVERVLTMHVRTVAKHFAGVVSSWDVVNEAFTDARPIQYRDTIWYRNLGEKYIAQAFGAAHAAAPDADLYYNDYNISGAIGPDKLDRILAMVDDLRSRQVPIDGIGFQMHIDTSRPDLGDIRASFAKVVKRGLKVRISELDVAVNSNERLRAFDKRTAERQRRRYADVVRAYVETVPPGLRGGITVWGLTDADSWIPVLRHRPDWPLLFDGEFTPKPAFFGFAAGLRPEK